MRGKFILFYLCMVRYCHFGVSLVNYSDSDVDLADDLLFVALRRSGMKPKVRARASELSPEPGYLNFRFFQN